MSFIDGEIAKLEEKIKELKKEKEAHQNLQDNEKLAILLHSKMCRFNHIDGCGWFYQMKNGIPTWKEYSQEEYLKKANKIIFEAKTQNINFKSLYFICEAL